MAKRKRANLDGELSQKPSFSNHSARATQYGSGSKAEMNSDDDDTHQFRRVRAHKGGSDDESSLASSDERAAQELHDGNSTSDTSSSELEKTKSDGALSTPESVISDSEPEDPEAAGEAPDEGVAVISFGALAKAQAALGRSSRTNHDRNTSTANPSSTRDTDVEALERRAGKKDTRDFDRTSKHAPTELSSKKAVSRKRSVVPVHQRDIRDPRFERISGPVDHEKVKRNYAFLSTYRDAEIAELKVEIRKTKDVAAKEKLKKALLSLESRKKTDQLKEQQQEVLRKHRKEEGEKVAATGKKPFHLKKSQVKERALLEKYKGMKGKQVDKAIERRRKKVTAKERKTMPMERRG